MSRMKITKISQWLLVTFTIVLLVCGLLIEPIEKSLMLNNSTNYFSALQGNTEAGESNDYDLIENLDDKSYTSPESPTPQNTNPSTIPTDNNEVETENTETSSSTKLPNEIIESNIESLENSGEGNFGNSDLSTNNFNTNIKSQPKETGLPDLTVDNQPKDTPKSSPTSEKTVTKTIQLGSDNPEHPGQAMGYTQYYYSNYYCNINYYTNTYYYKSGSVLYDYRGWVVFDLSDLTPWDDISVKDVKLLVHNYQMTYFDKINFTLLNTTPYNNPTLNTTKKVFNESGPSGTKIGEYNLTSIADTAYHTIKMNLTSLAVSAINDKLKNSSKYNPFAIGMHITKLQGSYTNGVARWSDIRLIVTFECNDTILQTNRSEGIALGDDLTGYLYSSSSSSATNYETGFAYTYSGFNYRSYMHWEMQKIRNLLSSDNQTDIYFTKVSLRFNHYNSEFYKICFYQMVNNVTNSSAINIYNDCGNGTKYLGPVSISEKKTTELEYDLGLYAVRDFQAAFNSNDTEAFFAVGLNGEATINSNSYDFGPRLVLEWADELPVYNVDKDEYYPNIQIGILDANASDTLLVKNGTYNENLIIEKPVNIIGENKGNTVIEGSGTGDVLYISGDDVTISGFTINGSGSQLGDAGIEIEDAKNCSIVNNIFLNHMIGILLDGSVNVTAENNSMSFCGLLIKGNQLDYWNTHSISENNTVNGKPLIYWKDSAIGIIPPGAGQVIIANCSNITIENQVLNQCNTGLTIGFSDYNLILNVTSNLNNNYGIYLKFSSYNQILNNYCEANHYGIALFNSTGNVIRKNQCFLNDLNGIHLVSSSNNIIEENYCQNNNNGIFLEQGINNTVIDNTCILNKDSGIQNIIKPGADAEKIPVDVVLTLDTSGSMSGQKIGDLKTAAKNFINHEFLNDQDRVAIFDFTYGITAPLQPFILCNASGKNKLISVIENLTTSGGTPLWDKIGLAVNYSINNGSTREPIVVVMTDGGDTSSYEYCPWHDWDEGNKLYRDVDGTTSHDYFYNGGTSPELESTWSWKNFGTTNEWRIGLLNSKNVTIHSVGLGIPHVNHSGDSCWRFSDGWYGAFAQYESVVNEWATNRNSSIYNESGTPEFNLWRMANTSGGEYFYAEESKILDSIFQRLVLLIKRPSIFVNSTISGNEVLNNKNGIYIKSSKGINISDNNCSNNEYGIKLYSSSNNNLVMENMIMNNTRGIYIDSSRNNTIYHNNFIKNGAHSLDNSFNIWNESFPIGGNYWDTWTTPDEDDNGFVDFPYNVSGGGNKDYLPFAKKNGWKNEPPSQPEVEVSPKTPTTVEDIICNITTLSVDEDGDTITYIYEWYLDRGSGFVLQDSLTQVTENLSVSISSSLTVKADLWRCVVTPYDGEDYGLPAYDQVLVINSPPSAPVVMESPATPCTSDDLMGTITTQSTDLDSDVIMYTYEWYRDLGSGFVLQLALTNVTSNLSASISAIFTLKNEVWRCVVTPNDGEANGPAVQDQVTIINSPPTTPIVDVTPSSPFTDDGLVCTVITQATDLDSDPILYTYEWYRDSGAGFVFQPGLTKVTSSLSASISSSYTAKDDIWRCVVTPNDGEENGTAAQDQVTVINSPPTPPIVSISPTNPKTTDNLDSTITTQSNDADLDTIKYTYQWYRDSGSGFVLIPGLTVVTDELYSSISSANTTKHDLWCCVVTPNDGTINGSTAQDQVTVINSPPVAIIDSPENGTEVEIGKLINFVSFNSTDPDKDSLTYEWDFNYDGKSFHVDATGKNVSHKWLSYYDGYVALRVKDGDGGFGIDTCYISVKNVPPSVKLRFLPTLADMALRIAGEKWHDVVVELYENNKLVANGSLTRYPGSPNEQMLKLSTLNLNSSKTYQAIIRYTPEDDKVNGQPNGATPCWLIIKVDGKETRLHHTFNVKQPKRHVWKVNLTKEIHVNNFTFEGKAYDSGPDNLTFYWDFGDGTNTSKFYENKNHTFPVEITQYVSHAYSSTGTYTVTLKVADDKGGVTVVKVDVYVS